MAGDKKSKNESSDDKKQVVTEEFLKTVGNKIRRRELGAQLKRQKKKVRLATKTLNLTVMSFFQVSKP